MLELCTQKESRNATSFLLSGRLCITYDTTGVLREHFLESVSAHKIMHLLNVTDRSKVLSFRS